MALPQDQPRQFTAGAKVLAFLTKRLTLIILLAAALVLRILIFQNITPLLNTDSVTYLVLRDLEPMRTPGYPLFIEAIQFFNDLLSITPQYLRLIVFFQMFLLGIVNTYLVYALSRVLTRSEGFALFMGLIFNLDYFVIGFEFLILTETLTFTLLGLTLLFYQKIFEEKRSAPYLAGIFSVWLLLTRPTFVAFFAFLLGLTAFSHLRQVVKGGYIKRHAKPLAIFLLINLVSIGSWCLRNKIKYDYFGISLILPYQLSYYTLNFYEKYKKGSDQELDRYAEILSEEKGWPYNFGYRLSTEMKMPDAEIARILMKLNVKLIRENFGDYLKLVPIAASGYFDYSWFWTIPHNKTLLSRVKFLASLFRLFFEVYARVFRNVITLLILIVLVPVAFIITSRKRKDVYHLLWLMEGVIHYNFLVSVLLTNAGINNLRFRVPVEPFILLIFYGALFTWGRSIFRRI
jgi:hypothetical protein